MTLSRKIAWAAGAFIAFVVVLSVAGYFLLPGLVRSQTEQAVDRLTHRRFQLEDVQFHPMTLKLDIRGLKLYEQDGQTVFVSMDLLEVRVSLRSLLHLAPVLREFHVEKPYVHVVLLGPRHYNFDDLLTTVSSSRSSGGSTGFGFAIHNIHLDNGTIVLDDRPGKVIHQVDHIQIALPYVSTFSSDEDTWVTPALSATIDGMPLKAHGQVLPFAPAPQARAHLQLEGIDLPHVSKWLPVRVPIDIRDGRANLQLDGAYEKQTVTLGGNLDLNHLDIHGHQWALSLPGGASLALHDARLNLGTGVGELAEARFGSLDTLHVEAGVKTMSRLEVAHPELELRDLQFGHQKYGVGALSVHMDSLHAMADRSSLKLSQMSLEGQGLETGQGHYAAGALSMKADEARVEDHAQHRFGVAHINGLALNLDGFATTMDDGVVQTALDNLHLKDLSVRLASFRIEDHARRHPVKTTLTDTRFDVQDFSPDKPQDSPIALSSKIDSAGSISLRGKASAERQEADLDLNVQKLLLPPFQPYLGPRVNFMLNRGTLSAAGNVRVARHRNQVMVRYQGKLQVNQVSVMDRQGEHELFNWRTLYLGGMDVRSSPLSVNIRQVALNQLSGKLVLNADGKLNLADLVLPETPAANSSENRVKATAAKPTARVPVTIGKVILGKGRIDFTDDYIQPHYSAHLRDLVGVVSGLSSTSTEPATFDFRGDVYDAPFNIEGRVNPFGIKHYLDLKARADGIDLSSLSPYAVRYIGYDISNGKLSFQVTYHVENSVLTAQNHLVLNQLELGHKVSTPDAPDLPVEFALSLLKNNAGVIDVNLPVDGSLNDPQFSVGGIVLRLVGNLIKKTVEAPFEFITGFFEHSETASWMAFDPGRARITQEGQHHLKSLARALNEHARLNLDIEGRADMEVDREGLKRALMERSIRKEYEREQLLSGHLPATDITGHVEVPKALYPQLLTKVYNQASFPKPRNLLGFAKSLPVPEMEKLLMANTVITPQLLAELAQRRAQAVQDWLVRQEHISPQRLFIMQGAKRDDTISSRAVPNRVDFFLK